MEQSPQSEVARKLESTCDQLKMNFNKFGNNNYCHTGLNISLIDSANYSDIKNYPLSIVLTTEVVIQK